MNSEHVSNIPVGKSDALATSFVGIETREAEPISVKYGPMMLSAVRRFFAWLESEERIFLSPFAQIVCPKMPKALPRDILSRDEVRRLLDAPDTRTAAGLRDRALIELLYSTGLRRGEALRLELSDVDLSDGRVFVKEGKGRKDRVVPIGETATTWLRRYLAKVRPSLEAIPTERIWLDEDGRPVAGRKLACCLKTYAALMNIRRRTGAPGISPHTLQER